MIDSLRTLAKSHPLTRPLYSLYRRIRHNRDRLRLIDHLVASRFRLAGAADGIAGDWSKVADHTQLSQSGILNLEILSRYVIDNGIAGAFVECGTWRGGALSFWARAFLRNGGEPDRNPIFGFDSFQGMPRMTAADGGWVAQMLYGRPIEQLSESDLDGSLTPHDMNAADESACREILAQSGFSGQHATIVKGWFQDTLPGWKQRIGPIAVLRLDGDWYESTRTCLEQLYDLVVPGGAVIIDDYGYFVGCQKAVSEFFAERKEAPRLLVVDDCVRFFIKPA